MKSLLVFNNMNDLIYWKWDHLFVKHILNLALTQGLIPEEKSRDEESSFTGELHPDIVIQIFSPIITSQKIMACQFGNSYTSVQCRDGTNLVFDEYVGYLFVHIGKDGIYKMQRNLAMCITILKYFCGPDPSFLKHDYQKAGVELALNCWLRLSERDQATVLNTTEVVHTSSEVTGVVLSALKAAHETLPHPPKPAHVAIFIKNKLLALYTSRNTEDLTPMDLLFLSILSHGAQDSWSRRPPNSTSESRSPSPAEQLEDTMECGDFGQTLSWMIMFDSGIPFNVHVRRLSSSVTLVMCVGGCGGAAPALHACLVNLAALSVPLAQRDPEHVKPVAAALDCAVKKALDALKKHKTQPDSPQKKLQSHWDSLKKKINEITKQSNVGANWMAAEAGLCPLRVALRTTYQIQCSGFSPTIGDCPASFDAVHSRLGPLYEFLRVKALKNFSIGSSPVMSKYVEEFPGLVHFLHIDRSSHRLTAPDLADCGHMLPKKKIWQMIEKGTRNVRGGLLATMWKDASLHYAHLVWWEDLGGSSLKPRHFTNSQLPQGNLTHIEFYNKLTELCFPGNGFKSVRCFELYAVHLGLLPPGTALAHVRRLAATVSDLYVPMHPMSLL